MRRFFGAFLALVMLVGLVPMVNAAELITVFVQVSVDNNIEIEVSSDASVEAVKAQIQEAEGISAENQVLYFNDEALENEKTLEQYNIQSEDLIYMRLYELDLSHLKESSGAEVSTEYYSYEWIVDGDDKKLTLTLKGQGMEILSLPKQNYGTMNVIINVQKDSFIGCILEKGEAYYSWNNITFSGNSTLTMDEWMLQGTGDNLRVTIDSGVTVNITGEYASVNFGASGNSNSTLKVNGRLFVTKSIGCGQLIIGDGGSVECSRVKLSGSGADDTDGAIGAFIIGENGTLIARGDESDYDASGNLYAAVVVILPYGSDAAASDVLKIPSTILPDGNTIKKVGEGINCYITIDDNDNNGAKLDGNSEFCIIFAATSITLSKNLHESAVDENSWITPPQIENWIYTQTPNTPVAEAAYGNPVFEYSDKSDGEYTAEVPANAGKWYMKVTVPATDEYTGLSSIVEFEILPKTISSDIKIQPPHGGRKPTKELETDEYTATVEWTPDDTKFGYSTEYSAIIKITPKENYTVDGIEENGYTVTDAKTVTNSANSDEVYVKFEKTGKKPSSGGGGGGTTRYTVKFETNGADSIAPVQVKRNTAVSAPAQPQKAGYSFEGWYKDKELTVKYDFSEKVIRNITLYAKWSEGSISGSLNREEHMAYVFGYPDGSVRPGAYITRAEVTSIFLRLLKVEVREAEFTQISAFSDVNADAWYNAAVSTMAKLNIVKGRTDKIFAPDDYITRAEFAAICARLDDSPFEIGDSFTDVGTHWAADEIYEAAAHGWINGYEDGSFAPDAYITRAEAITMINRVLDRVPKSAADLHEDMIKWNDNSDEEAWYYIAVQEATNTHDYTMNSGASEKWISVNNK